MKALIVLLTVAAILAAACGARKGNETAVAPAASPGGDPYSVYLDTDVDRLLGDPPAVGRLPSSTTWAPDSSAVVYLRTSTEKSATPRTELWIHEMLGHRERPLFSEAEDGVTAYSWCGGKHLVAASSGDLHLIGLTGERRRLTETDDAEEAARCSPDGALVAFVRNHDLVVLDLRTGRERQLTEGGSAELTRGEVTWVYGEEFRTEEGFAWSADSKHLWFYETDLGQVRSRRIVTSADGSTRLQPYPRAGEPNPAVRVGVLDATSDDVEPVWLSTGGERDVYLPQVTWHPGGERLLAVRLDRLQTILELLACDAASGACSQILAERDPRWVNLLGPPTFLDGGESFLWLSEKDGFAHIYRYGIDGIEQGRLTRGKWVVASVDGVDEESGEVFFTGNAEDPTEYGVFRVRLDDDEVEEVSRERGCHRAVFSPDFGHFLDRHSALDRPPRVDLRRRDGEPVTLLARADLREYRGPEAMNDVFPIETRDGTRLMALLTRPVALEPERRYPVLIHVYGGPHAQVVRNAFRPSFQPWRDLLASRGVLVFSVDGRGSGGRGHEFETPIHRRLGEVELEDQLAGVDYLKSLPFVDAERIGIFGWSYGGTMTLNALLRTEGVFQVGVAVAPVTDWRDYDSAYTERYMQRPSDNPDGYDATALPPLAKELRAPLLLVHGLADDNVHFTNSARLADAFVEAGRAFEMAFYPGKSHGIRGGRSRVHLFSRITRFLERHL
jgi:dipeptidyl-peptidase-4